MLAGFALAETAAFDLVGPNVEVRVRRDGETLPISEVPSLQAGDRLWVHPDLPDSQSVHYVMVVAFLRGATNPPPDSWFTRVEAWSRPVHEEGVYVTVPEGAEEALVLLAPDTGGAFSTLRSAVRGKPGAFVRAAQDLEQASLDRARLEKYLEVVRETSTTDPEQLKARTTLLARSLNIRIEQQCFDKPSAQQVPCLTTGAGRRSQPDDGCNSDLGSFQRPVGSDQFHTHGPQWILQPLHWRRGGCSQDFEYNPHRAISVHSRAGLAQAGRTQSAAQQPSVVPQP
jgi:hypothetical protein